MTNEHTSLEKYSSHILFKRVAKELCMRGELETATYLPQIPLSLAALLSHSVGLLNRGSWGPSSLLGAGSHCLELQQNWLQLTDSNSLELSVAPGYIIVWRHLLPVGVTIAPNSTRPLSRLYLDMFDRMHLLFTQVHLLFDSSAEGQYATPALDPLCHRAYYVLYIRSYSFSNSTPTTLGNQSM